MIKSIKINARQRVHNHKTWSYHICTHENSTLVYNFVTPFKSISIPKHFVGLQGLIAKFSFGSKFP
jgi:hypothetical protein